MTYILFKRAKGTIVGDILGLTLPTGSHVGDGLVRSAAGETLIENLLNSTAEPVSSLIDGRTGTLLGESRGQAGRGQKEWCCILHGSLELLSHSVWLNV